jgi:hypothetical protein
MQCSPCFREFRQFEEQIKHERRRRLAVLIALAAACIIIALILANARFRRAPVQTASMVPLPRTIDLWDVDTNRGVGEPRAHTQVGGLPAALVNLRLVLPRFSRPGKYEIAICQDRTADSALAHSKAKAVADGPREIVTVVLDLSALNKGQGYWLSARRDQDDASYYFPIKVS